MTDSMPYEPLTPREREFLTLLCEWLSNREIGERMHISLATGKWLTAQLRSKLGACTRREIIQRAAELGLYRGGGTTSDPL